MKQAMMSVVILVQELLSRGFHGCYSDVKTGFQDFLPQYYFHLIDIYLERCMMYYFFYFLLMEKINKACRKFISH